MTALRRVFPRTLRRGSRVFAGLAAGLLAHSAQSAASPSPTDKLADVLPLFAVLTGELHGELTTFPNRPITWRLALADDDASGVNLRTGELVVSGPDLAISVALTYEPRTRRVTWRALQGNVDIGAWWASLAALPDLASMAEGVTASGILTLAGEGTWIDGAASGGLRVELKDAVVRNEAEGWTLDGVSIIAGGDASKLVLGKIPIELTVRTIGTARFGARALTVTARIDNLERADVTSARVEIAGGEVVAEPFAVTLVEPTIDVKLLMRGVGLEDIVALVPESLAEGRGHVNGSVRLGWSQAGGIAVKEGSVSLAGDKPALVRFHPNIGLLTGSLPSGILKHYPGLLKIETGEMPLLATKFDIRLTPEGDAEGRSARVRIEGGPTDPSLTAPLVLNVNVTGPLAPLIKLGSGVSLGTSP